MIETTVTELTGYPSVDKPWLKYYSEEAANAPIPQCTLYERIREYNADHPHDVALLYFGKKVQYSELFARIEQAAKALVACGAREGDNIAICMPAMPETIYLVLAANWLGINACLLNPTFMTEQLSDRIGELDAKLLFIADELYPMVKEAVNRQSFDKVVSCAATNSLGLVARIATHTAPVPNAAHWKDFIHRGEGASLPGDLPYQLSRPAILVYSSGTTGASKGIQLTNDGINATITEYEVAGHLFERQDRYFAQVPIWFSTGIAVTMLVPLCLGITVILEPMYDFKLFSEHIRKYRPNFIITASGLIEHLMKQGRNEAAFKVFKYLCIGGEYVPGHFEARVNDWLHSNGNPNELHRGWGMCECGGTVTYSVPACNVIGSAGIPTPHVAVAAFDQASDTELTYGQRGELRVLTPCRMSGYYKRPDATEEYFHEDVEGRMWACTGDMGYVAQDGNVYVLGRISDSYVNARGTTVYLFDIERAVLACDKVCQCKVIATEIDGEPSHVAHVVFAKSCDQGVALAELASACEGVLDDAYWPRLLKLWGDALPVAPSGKLDTAVMEASVDGLIELEKPVAETIQSSEDCDE